MRHSIVENTSSDSKILSNVEIPWLIDPIKKDLIDIDLSLSTDIVFLNLLIFLDIIRENFLDIINLKYTDFQNIAV